MFNKVITRSIRSIAEMKLLNIALKYICIRKQHRSSKIIQEWWRQVIATDPITLGRIKIPFLLIRSGSVIKYDAYSLYEYIITCGDTRDPVCRILLNDIEMNRLDRTCGSKNLLSSKKNCLRAIREKCILNISLCDALEREILKYISELVEYSDENAVKKLHDEYGGILIQCFGNLKSIDDNRCILVLTSIVNNLKATIDKSTMPMFYVYINNMLNALISQCI